MSADEPRIAKYGLPASESQRVVDNHFVVTQERALLHERHFEHALRVGPGLRAALDAVGSSPAPDPVTPTAAPEPETVAAPAPAPTVARRGPPDGLRERLGLR